MADQAKVERIARHIFEGHERRQFLSHNVLCAMKLAMNVVSSNGRGMKAASLFTTAPPAGEDRADRDRRRHGLEATFVL